MEGFLGGLAQLYQFVQQASHEKYQQIQPSVSITGLTPGSATSLFFFPGLSLCTSSSSPFFLLHIPPLLQLQFVSCDRGVYTYRADTLVVSLSLDMGTVPTLKLGIKPAQGSRAGAVCVCVWVGAGGSVRE